MVADMKRIYERFAGRLCGFCRNDVCVHSFLWYGRNPRPIGLWQSETPQIRVHLNHPQIPESKRIIAKAVGFLNSR